MTVFDVIVVWFLAGGLLSGIYIGVHPTGHDPSWLDLAVTFLLCPPLLLVNMGMAIPGWFQK